jgi:prefoldin subunit 5
MEINNNCSNYTNYYTNTKQKSGSEAAENTTDKQITSRTYSSAREYRTYLTEKYDCLKNSDYSVAINSSLLSEATGDEKTAKWLEYNLSLIPETVEKTKAMVQARGGQIISYNITINGYDSMTAELCTKYEADPGTEKAREDLKERIKKIKEEKAEKEKKLEEKLEEKRAEKKADEEARTETPDYTVSATGTDIKTITQQVISISLGTSATTVGSFDIKA